MTHPVKSAEVEHPLPVKVQDLRSTADRAAVIEHEPVATSMVARRARLRRLLMASATAALLAGAAWYGVDYWTVGRYLVSTDDAYVKADNTTDRAQGLRLHRRSTGRRQRAGQGRPGAGAYRRSRFQGRARPGRGRCRSAPTRRSRASRPSSMCSSPSSTPRTGDDRTSTRPTQTFASQENKRYTDLAKTGFGSVQNAQQAQSRDAGALGGDRAGQRDT